MDFLFLIVDIMALGLLGLRTIVRGRQLLVLVQTLRREVRLVCVEQTLDARVVADGAVDLGNALGASMIVPVAARAEEVESPGGSR